ncbi:Leucine-rich repeat-containing protein 71 [Dinochytrium kinnereticum]|nr:Leucine-rich repeat-containing protein 71 [Dinochytrium kinnereticum]
MIAIEDEKDSIVFTGNFEADYQESCRRLSVQDAPAILRIPFPLPPIPIPILPVSLPTPPSRDSTPKVTSLEANVTVEEGISEDPKPVVSSSTEGGGAVVEVVEPGTSGEVLPPVPHAEAGAVAVGGERPLSTVLQTPPPLPPQYRSRYKFRPTICLEADEDEEIYKVELRGWKLSLRVLEALCFVMPGYNSINSLVLWNCNLQETHFPPILTTILSTNIRNLSIDQNPSIPDHLFAYLISEESSLKTLSLRMNKIGDIGAKAIAGALKTNRVLMNLNLWGNAIGREGAGDLAEALKFNQSLSYLSLGRNPVGDEGAAALGKVLSNSILLHDEIISRRKALLELEKQRREQEEDPIVKKAKGRINTSHGRNSSASAKIKSEETLNKKDPNPPADAKTAKKGAAAAKSNKKADPPQPPQKRTPDTGPAAANNQGGRKGTAPGNAASAAEDKKGGKDKKGASGTAKGSKKTKVEEMREETEERNPFVDQDSQGEKAHDRKEEEDSEEGNSVLEEES